MTKLEKYIENLKSRRSSSPYMIKRLQEFDAEHKAELSTLGEFSIEQKQKLQKENHSISVELQILKEKFKRLAEQYCLSVFGR